MPPDTSVTDADVRTVLSAARSRLRHTRNSPHPRKRAEKAAVVAHDVQAQADTARTARDQAATALQMDHGWEPVQVYDLIGVTRGLYARIRTRTTARRNEYRTHTFDRLPPTQQQWLARYADALGVDTPQEALTAWLDRYDVYAHSERAASAAAAEHRGVPERLANLAEQARQIRDDAVRDLLTGESGDKWSNADVARLTKLTTARIAQLRPDAKGKAA